MTWHVKVKVLACGIYYSYFFLNSIQLKLLYCILSYLKTLSVFFCHDVRQFGGFDEVPDDVETIHLTLLDSAHNSVLHLSGPLNQGMCCLMESQSRFKLLPCIRNQKHCYLMYCKVYITYSLIPRVKSLICQYYLQFHM